MVRARVAVAMTYRQRQSLQRFRGRYVGNAFGARSIPVRGTRTRVMRGQYQHGDDLRPMNRAKAVINNFLRKKVVPLLKTKQRRRAFARFQSKRKFPKGTGISKRIMGYY